MRLSQSVSQPHSSASGAVRHLPTGGAVSRPPQSGVRKPIVVAKIKPPQFEIDETPETATHPAVDLSLIDWVVHPDTKRILFFVQGDDWFIDQRLLPSEFVKQAYREAGLKAGYSAGRSCPTCS